MAITAVTDVKILCPSAWACVSGRGEVGVEGAEKLEDTRYNSSAVCVCMSVCMRVSESTIIGMIRGRNRRKMKNRNRVKEGEKL